MLRQGPVDKNDGIPCETWELSTGFTGVCCNAHPTIVIAGDLNPAASLMEPAGLFFWAHGDLKHLKVTSTKKWAMPAGLEKCLQWKQSVGVKAPHRTYSCVILSTLAYTGILLKMSADVQRCALFELPGDELASGRDVCRFLDLSNFPRHSQPLPPLSQLHWKKPKWQDWQT